VYKFDSLSDNWFVRFGIVKQLLFIVKRMDKKGFRVLMKHCFLAKKILKAMAWLDKHYSDSAPAKSSIEK
jgi:hypothetical protein